VSQVLLPIGLLLLLQRTVTLAPHHIWMAIVIGHFTRASLSIWRFRLGKWRSIRIAARTAV
jgi:Na+-driven multidrug efflux pump